MSNKHNDNHIAIIFIAFYLKIKKNLCTTCICYVSLTGFRLYKHIDQKGGEYAMKVKSGA